MARPRTLPDDHFCFSTFRKGDSTYVYGYRNEWDPEKKQSRIAKRIYVGTLNEITGRVKLGKKYLSNHPEYEGKTLYFENRTLVERSEQEVAAEVGQRETSWASNNLSYAATWALWQFAIINEADIENAAENDKKRGGSQKTLAQKFSPQLLFC